MQCIQQCGGISERRKRLARATDDLKVTLKFQRAGRTDEVITDPVPR
jgi:hypothetical protein